MNKTIWTCWFQGRENAPDLVQRCMSSWEKKNPGWAFRCLDATTAGLYVDVEEVVDLKRQAVTAASLSDILRILLLREYGGVWVDATLYCNRPLDEWLNDVFSGDFFAFAAPAENRPLSSWFIAATATSTLLARWHAHVARYWRDRTAADDYFWFHHQFAGLCASDPEAQQLWDKVPKISADPPHSFQNLRSRCKDSTEPEIDWGTPVFKLRHNMEPEDYREGHPAYDLLHREGTKSTATALATVADRHPAVDKSLLPLLVPARIENSSEQVDVVVVSPDDWVVTSIRKHVGAYRRVSPVLDEVERLGHYRSHAKIVVTTMAQCALQAIGMGVPVVIFFPPGGPGGMERKKLAALQHIVPVFELDEKGEIDWRGYRADVGHLKRVLREASAQGGIDGSNPRPRPPLEPIAPPETLPVPES